MSPLLLQADVSGDALHVNNDMPPKEQDLNMVPQADSEINGDLPAEIPSIESQPGPVGSYNRPPSVAETNISDGINGGGSVRSRRSSSSYMNRRHYHNYRTASNNSSPVRQDINRRFANLESRLNRFTDLFEPEDLGEPVEHDITYESSDDGDANFDLHGRRARSYMSHVLWFVGRSRGEFERATKARKERERLRKATIAKGYDVELPSLEALSTTAYWSGEAAKMCWMDWIGFLAPKGRYEDSAAYPLTAVIGEPEPQTILPLYNLTAKQQGKSTSISRRKERPKASADVPGQTALPERIKIHSGPLYRILRKLLEARPSWYIGEDGSMVFLRPFKEFIYYEKQLEDSLTKLEKRAKSLRQNSSQLESTAETIEPLDKADKVEEADAQPENDGGRQRGEKTQSGHEDEVDKKSERGVQVEEGDDGPNPVATLLHLRCLVGFLNDEIKIKAQYVNSDKCTKIFFHDLWHLLKPGNEVVDQREKQAYRVVRVEIPRHKVEDPWLRWTYSRIRRPDNSSDEEEEEDTPVKVHCAYVDFDGKQFGPVSVKFAIQPYGGLKDIRSLPVYPLRFAKDAKFREKLIDRGKMLLDVAKFRPMYYSGYTLDTRDEIDSQVVVDFSEALANETRRKWTPKIDTLRTAPDRKDDVESCTAACCAGQGVGNDEYVDSRLTEEFLKSLLPEHSLRAPSLLLSPRSLEETQIGSEDEPTDDEYVVMTYRVFAFVLRSRKWAQLDLTFLRYQNKDARNFTLSAFDQLELPDGHRDMVKSLVTQHFRDRQSNSNEQTDLIKGKGKGLIILLHGAPGVGKTTTAEGVAELFQKPLFQITCGDLGNTARDVEGELEKNFTLASRWGCILLLDEADVFLSARERKDFERNGLVAVFLRVLEYYAGILFLTTNRIGDFDEAFASRIHMSLYYPELDEAKTKRVFTLNLDLIQQRFDLQSRKITFDASSIESFAGHHFQNHAYNRWNGRQIRNLCQTALALAEFDAHGRDIDGKVKKSATVQLQLKYFETVQKAYLEFGRYLGNVRGTQGDQRAFDNGWRAKEGTPYQTTPSRFSRGDDSRHGARHAASLSETQLSAQGDPFQSLGGQSYPSGMSPNMRSSHSQYHPQGQGYGGNHGIPGYESHQGYPPPSGQQAQTNPGFYTAQQPPHVNFTQPTQQSWGGSNTPMTYNPMGQPSSVQVPQGQSFQASNMPGPGYGYPNMPSGPQSDTMGGANSSGQMPQGAPVRGPGAGGITGVGGGSS